ncbi:hypothetical protein [Candidatus Neoehrlichia procyonis]|uniref:hypothetical protein n=1 Tax=Candidatus Neoehrlichia procyonis TaxID=467750 RepID=UPI0018DB2622|nr:hypothetical protein [Candidatus Neoehrlichia lotoris]
MKILAQSLKQFKHKTILARKNNTIQSQDRILHNYLHNNNYHNIHHSLVLTKSWTSAHPIILQIIFL